MRMQILICLAGLASTRYLDGTQSTDLRSVNSTSPGVGQLGDMAVTCTASDDGGWACDHILTVYISHADETDLTHTADTKVGPGTVPGMVPETRAVMVKTKTEPSPLQNEPAEGRLRERHLLLEKNGLSIGEPNPFDRVIPCKVYHEL